MDKKRKKTIWLDISFSKMNENCGIAEYEKTVIKALEKDYNLSFFYNPFCKCSHYKGILYFIWLNTFFYIKTLLFKPDIIFLSAYDMPIFVREKTKYFVVFHDLILANEEYSTPHMIKKFQFLIDIAKKNAEKIITVSNTIKKQLMEQFDIPEYKIAVVYNAIGENFKKNIENAEQYKDLQPKKYIFTVSGSYVHKNVSSLIKAFEMISGKYPDLKLVISGYHGNIEYKENYKNVIFTGYVSDLELASLYKNAFMYVFPSLEEGFGIPTLEAQYSNIPLLCSDISVFREVAGNGAEFCEPTPEGIAEKLEYLINNPVRREELIKHGQDNLKRFSLDNIRKQLLEVFDE